MDTRAFLLGSHPALAAAELAAYGERHGLTISWDLSRLPAVLFGTGKYPAAMAIQRSVGGTTMIGTLRTTFAHLPSPADVVRAVPEITDPRHGKRIIGLSATPVSPIPVPHSLVVELRQLAMDLKREIGMKGTRVVFPAARRSDLSSAQMLHNKLPQEGVALLFLVAPERVDLVTLDSVQDIESYARRDRGRPHADPGRGMLPPKVAQMLLNLSLVPPPSAEATGGKGGGTIYDPFCGVGTIPMEALLMGLNVVASDVSPTQVERTKENLAWVSKHFPIPHAPSPMPHAEVFVHDISKGSVTRPPNSVDAIVTEGWLGPARTRPPLPREIDNIFQKVRTLLERLLHATRPVVRNGGRAVVTVPAFRVKKRILHFPLEVIRVHGWSREPLIPQAWLAHPLFREAAGGTLRYGRPDALVLREIVRWRRK